VAGLSFGIKTSPQHTSYEAIREVWRQADAEPAIEHAWLFDHLNPIQGDVAGPCLEGWTALTALAVETSRLRIGLMVAGNTYRHPAVLAHVAATLDVISGGRVDLGIGAGWNEYEHTSNGIPLYAPGERIRRLDEACELMKRLFTQPVTTFEGRYYQLREARLEPKPVHKPYPPIVIGGGGEQLTLRVVAKHADTKRVDVSLERCPIESPAPGERASIRLTVRDYGRGFVAESPEIREARGGPGERVGMTGMRERIALLDGEFRVESRPGEGTLIVAEVPLLAGLAGSSAADLVGKLAGGAGG
jgi:hypothetical protein